METRERVVSLGRRSHADRIAELTAEIEAELNAARQEIRYTIITARDACKHAHRSYPLSAGESEEFRQLSETMSASLDRLGALEARKP